MVMTKKIFFILISYSLCLLSQDEILRIETIDVFKEYNEKYN